MNLNYHRPICLVFPSTSQSHWLSPNLLYPKLSQAKLSCYPVHIPIPSAFPQSSTSKAPPISPFVRTSLPLQEKEKKTEKKKMLLGFFKDCVQVMFWCSGRTLSFRSIFEPLYKYVERSLALVRLNSLWVLVSTLSTLSESF